MADKEVDIGGNVVGENTKVTLTVKMAFWILAGIFGFISTAATIGYFDIKSDINVQKVAFEEERKAYKEEIAKMLREEVKDLRDKDESIADDISDIKGNVKVILDRTSGIRSGDRGLGNGPGGGPPDTQ